MIFSTTVRPQTGTAYAFCYAFRFAISVSIVILCFGLQGISIAAPVVMHASGAAQGAGRDAHNAAIENAQMSVIIDFLESSAEIADLSIFKPILDRPSAYIRSLTETHYSENEGITHVECEITLFEDMLRGDMLKLVSTQTKHKPVVLLIILEQPEPGADSDPFLENGIASRFRQRITEKEFELAHFFRPAYENETLLQRLRGDAPMAGLLARENRADVIVLGETTWQSEPTAASSNLAYTKLECSLRVIRADNDVLVDQWKTEAAVNSHNLQDAITMAVSDVFEKSIDRLLFSITLAGIGQHPPTGLLYIDIENPGSQEHIDAITIAIKNAWGVEDVQVLISHPGLARFKTIYSGPLAPLTEALTGYADLPFKLTPYRIVEGEMLFRIEEPVQTPQ